MHTHMRLWAVKILSNYKDHNGNNLTLRLAIIPFSSTHRFQAPGVKLDECVRSNSLPLSRGVISNNADA